MVTAVNTTIPDRTFCWLDPSQEEPKSPSISY